MEDVSRDEVPLLSTEEAIAEVRRWLEDDRVDPDRIFAAFGETTFRYGDLIGHLEQGTPDGELLRFAISRGRAMQGDRDQEMRALLQIMDPPGKPVIRRRTQEPPAS